MWDSLSRNNKISIHTFVSKCGVDTDENMLHNCINSIYKTDSDELSELDSLLKGFKQIQVPSQ